MAGVLTNQSAVTCGHGGTVQTAGNNLLTVDSNAVLTKDGVSGETVKTCGTNASSDSSGPIDVTCTQVTSVDKTLAKRLYVGDKAVLIEPLSGGTNGLKNKKPTEDLTVDHGTVQQLLNVE